MKRILVLALVAVLLSGCDSGSARSDGEDHSASGSELSQAQGETTVASDDNYTTVWVNGEPMTVDPRQWDLLHPDRVKTYSTDLSVDPSRIVSKENPKAMQVVVNDVTYYIDPSRVTKRG